MKVRHILTLGSACLLLGLSACGRGSSVNSDLAQKTPSQVVATDKYAVTVSFVDAATGKLLASKVDVALKGDLAAAASNALGAKVTSLSVTNGIASFYVGRTGTLELTASANGYVQSGTSLRIENNIQAAEVRLVSLANPPAGTEVKLDAAPIKDGKLSEPLKVEYATTAGTSKVEVPTGAVLKAADGSVLSGNVQLMVMAVDLASTSAMAVVPQGTITTDDGEQPLNLEGVFAVEITDASGKSAATVNPPIQFSMPVSSSLENPATKKAYAAGDSVEIVSYSHATGEWKVEGHKPLVTENGKLVVKFEADHLCFWGWRRWYPANFFPRVCSPVTFELPGKANVNVAVSLSAPGFFSAGFSLGGDNVKLATDPTRQLTLNAMWGTSGTYTTKGTYKCGDRVTLKLPNDTADVSESFNVIGICTVGGKTELLDSLEISVIRDGIKISSARTDSNGAAVVAGLKSGATYSYSVQLADKQIVSGQFIAGGAPTVISASVTCEVITGITGGSGDN